MRNVAIAAERGAVVYHAKDIHFDNVKMQAAKSPALTTFNAAVEGIAVTPLAPHDAQR